MAEHGRLCRDVARNELWLGVFTYEGTTSQACTILEALCLVYRETGIAINCIACGNDLFVRYWPPGECEPGDNPTDAERKYWRAYNLQRLAPSYFISNLIHAICGVDRKETDYLEGAR